MLHATVISTDIVNSNITSFSDIVKFVLMSDSSFVTRL